MAGAELEVSSMERSVIGTQGAKCQSTEKSVDRHGGPSTEGRVVCRRYGVRKAEDGAIQVRREALGVEYGAIRKRG